MPAIKNIIFDLGGVIMNIDFKLTEKAFANLGFDFAKYMTQFHITPFFEEYETGKIDDVAFVKGIQQIAGKLLTEKETLESIRSLLLNVLKTFVVTGEQGFTESIIQNLVMNAVHQTKDKKGNTEFIDDHGHPHEMESIFNRLIKKNENLIGLN